MVCPVTLFCAVMNIQYKMVWITYTNINRIHEQFSWLITFLLRGTRQAMCTVWYTYCGSAQCRVTWKCLLKSRVRK
jgi:hypothetical protein